MAAATNQAYKGRLLLVKVETGASPTTFQTVMGVRSRSMTINNEIVDITDSDTAPFRQILEDAGQRTITLTFSGVFKDDAGYRRVQENAHNATIDSYQLQHGNGDTIEGAFIVTSLEESGEYNGEQTYSCTLENAGTWNFQRSA